MKTIIIVLLFAVLSACTCEDPLYYKDCDTNQYGYVHLSNLTSTEIAFVLKSVNALDTIVCNVPQFEQKLYIEVPVGECAVWGIVQTDTVLNRILLVVPCYSTALWVDE